MTPDHAMKCAREQRRVFMHQSDQPSSPWWIHRYPVDGSHVYIKASPPGDPCDTGQWVPAMMLRDYPPIEKGQKTRCVRQKSLGIDSGFFPLYGAECYPLFRTQANPVGVSDYWDVLVILTPEEGKRRMGRVTTVMKHTNETTKAYAIALCNRHGFDVNEDVIICHMDEMSLRPWEDLAII